MTNTLAYYDTAKITTVKCFIVQAPGYYENLLKTIVKSFVTLGPECGIRLKTSTKKLSWPPDILRPPRRALTL